MAEKGPRGMANVGFFEIFTPKDRDDEEENNIIFEMSAAQPEVEPIPSPFEIDERTYSSYKNFFE